MKNHGGRAGLGALFLLLAAALPSPAPAAGEGYTEPAAGMELILVRGGAYLMGDFTGRGLDRERPAHPVEVSDFYLGRHEVTVAQFRVFTGQSGYRTEAERAGSVIDIDQVMLTPVRREGISWRDPGFSQAEDSPVVWVTWNDAAEFARWLARSTGKPYRLPTEAEWEYAARDRGQDVSWCGTAEPPKAGRYVWSSENSGGAAHQVGGKSPNALGFHDLCGNVWEWCLDIQVAYRETAEPVRNPKGPAEGDYRVLRGGSWRVGLEITRSTYRNGYRPGYSHSSIGFRVALEAPTLL